MSHVGGGVCARLPHVQPLGLLGALCTPLATGFHRFLARFSGRRRVWRAVTFRSPPPWTILVLVLSTFISIAEACSSRTTPKPRPPVPTPRPNITFHTFVCPPAYATWYCLNGATCFTVRIGESLLYNCECADGYMGPRCEYKDLDGSYLPSQRRFMLETASIAGGATIAALMVVILCVVMYVHLKRKAKQARGVDCVDGATAHVRARTFGKRWTQHPTHTNLTFNDRGDEPRSTSKPDLHQVTTLLPGDP